jgi:hypothetical protein
VRDGRTVDAIGRLDPEWAARRWREWASGPRPTVESPTLAIKLGELGFMAEAIALCRRLTDEDNGSAYTLLTLLDMNHDTMSIRQVVNELPDLKSVRYHPAVQSILRPDLGSEEQPDDIRVIAARLHATGDLNGLRRHGHEHPDKVVSRHLAELLLERGLEDEAVTLAQSSKGARRAYIAYLVDKRRWPNLGRLIAQGDELASSELRSHLNGDHPLDDIAQRIKRDGLTATGEIR